MGGGEAGPSTDVAVDRTPRLHFPLGKPTDIIPHLGKGAAHWREGYSAHALATTWFSRNGLPTTVSALLDRHDHFRGAELVDAILERKTDLRDGVRGQSQTDLLAILAIGTNLAVAAVEGKVEEPFGPLVSEWLDDTQPRQARMNKLTTLLGVSVKDVLRLRYQLFHRTAAAIYEAQRYRAPTALLLVHSFSGKRTGWTDFAAFSGAIGVSLRSEPGSILGPKRIGDIDLFTAWLTDKLP